MTTKMIEAYIKPIDMCKFKFYKSICTDGYNNFYQTIAEIQIDTSIGKQTIAIHLTDEHLGLCLSDLFDVLYLLATEQWQNS